MRAEILSARIFFIFNQTIIKINQYISSNLTLTRKIHTFSITKPNYLL